MFHAQCGTFANYLGSHYWNLVDDNFIESDESSFSEGKPNLFILESSLALGPTGFEGFGGMEAGNHTEFNINENVEIRNEEKEARHEYQKYLEDLESGLITNSSNATFDWDSSVRYWCDFWKARPFPDCMQILPPAADLRASFWWENSVDVDFTESSIRKSIERMDTIHASVNSCDLLEGFAPYYLKLLEFIRDEFPKKSILTYLPCENKPSDSFYINFSKVFEVCESFSTILVADAQNTYNSCIKANNCPDDNHHLTKFTSSAALGAQLQVLWDTKNARKLDPGLIHTEMVLTRTNDIQREGLSFQRELNVPTPFPQRLLRNSGENVEQMHANVQVFTRHTEKSRTLKECSKAMEVFRKSELRKNDILELDEWLATEELIRVSRDNEAVEGEDSESDQ